MTRPLQNRYNRNRTHRRRTAIGRGRERGAAQGITDKDLCDGDGISLQALEALRQARRHSRLHREKQGEHPTRL